MKLFLFCDTGPSGHGTVGREFMKHLLDEKKVELNVGTHEWGFNLHGWFFGARSFPDKRLIERLIQTKRINKDCFLNNKREFKYRVHNIDNIPASTIEAESKNLMIHDFKDKEDINITIGGLIQATRQPKYAYRITETTQNTTKCPDRWRMYNDKTDEIWVPSKWAKNGLLNAFDEEKIKIMPYGVDFIKPTFNDKMWQLHKKKFIFGTCARWTNLKAHDILVKAYVEEFTEKDDVMLFIKTTINNQANFHGDLVMNTINRWINDLYIIDPPEIGISTEAITIQEYWDMMNCFDCFVLPSRAEAIGISNVQAMSLGIPTISTNYSDIKTYLNKNNGFPIDVEDEVDIQHHCKKLFFYGDEYRGKWAMPSQSHLQEQMRKVYEMSKENPRKLQEIADKGKEKVRSMFDWKKHMKTRMNRLEAISSKN